jgi:hypothetical protein
MVSQVTCQRTEIRDQWTEKRWLGFVVSQVRKSGHGAPKFYVIDTMGYGPPAKISVRLV